MTSTDIVTLYVMAENEDAAVHISTALVRGKLIACANVQPGTRSIYEANGLISLENEVKVIMKTTKEKAPAAIEEIKNLHSYQVPCITVLPVIDGNPEYFEWVRNQVAD
ncbi:divalent-cation tolerance protein CutA [Kordiimonas sediminis]|uniref:Divalent-cation tolerance protein CutA n=1 Tax=Kordiimonas sediminis TaxID=1735581 RepID=A0A919E862_9PROT|nr:divalent-cation tolerance protein CutA [Kordiimonas sediminis]GHF27799.1 divalent-cation tolerance protein CutA [Kordiimonas sediminis]